MFLQILLLVGGLALLIKGADWLVNGASSIAKKYNVSDLAIGLTVVAFGTSAPELVVNIIASSENLSEIVYGNILGSNISNLLLILGITGLIYPIAVQSTTIWREIPMSLFAVVLLYFLSNNFFFNSPLVLSRIDGAILLFMFFGFMLYMYNQLKTDHSQNETVLHTVSSTKAWVFVIIGVAGLVIGGKFVVDSAVKIAAFMGVSEKIIGFTIIAIGTSLPELATSVVAAVKKNTNIAVGNIIGSNIFNIFLILAVSSLVKPISFNPAFNSDMYLLGGGTLLLFIAMFTGTRKKLDRWEALILLISYIGYTVFLVEKEL